MKNRIKILCIIIIYILLVICGMQIYLPSADFGIEEIARDADGNIYAAGDNIKGIFIYKMDAYGNAEKLSYCAKEARESELFCRYYNDSLFIGQMWYEEGKQFFSVWKREDELDGFQCIWKRTLEDNVKLTDFHVKENEIYVICIEQKTEDILLYVWKNGNDALIRYETDFMPTMAYYGNEGVYALSHDNHVYYLDLNGIKKETGLDQVAFLITDDNGLYYQKINSRDITYVFYSGLGGYTFKDIGDVWNIQYSGRTQNSAALIYKDGKDSLFIIGQDGKYGDPVNLGALGIKEKINCAVKPLLVITIVYVAVVIIFILYVQLVRNKRKLLHQTMTVLVGASGIWLAVTVLWIQIYEQEMDEKDRLFLADTCMMIQKNQLEEGLGNNQLTYEEYLGSSQQQLVEKIFTNRVMGNSLQSFFAREELVYGSKSPVFVFSEEASYGRKADNFYNASTMKYIKECIETGENQSFIDRIAGISYAISISTIGNRNSEICLVSRVPLYGIENSHTGLKVFYLITFVSWIFIMILLMLLLRHKWQNVELLVTQMDKVSRGEYTFNIRKIPDNEFGNMWTALERMCKNLQMQKYRNTNILDYLYQYAPKNYERLFEKEKLQDIEVGETVQITATLGMISVIDKDTLLTGKLQRQYVQYVNQLMEMLFSQKESEQAIFLQNGSNLENVKVIFKEDGESAITAVKYSMNCLENLQEKAENKFGTNPFILLHTGSFNCGLAGGSKQVYPYVMSLEIETLNRYIDALKNSGAKLVVTENVWLQVEKHVQGRYIGYVTSKDRKSTFRLYEILNACPQQQKISKIKNKDSFNAALQLYYNNDLYLARSAFADILKECPEDGIARWYVFACDRLFNREDIRDENYELFSELR